MRYAVVENGVVVNVVRWDGVTDWTPGEGRTVIAVDDVDIGHLYDAEERTFSAPKDPSAEPDAAQDLEG